MSKAHGVTSGLRRVWIVSAAGWMLSACATLQTSPRSVDSALTPGILLEPEQRTALPPGVELRRVYERGLQVTKLSEGFRSRLYNDAAGFCTIAYGHLIKLAVCDGTEPTEFLKGVSEPRGGELLVKDMAKAQRAVMTAVTINLTDGQYAALCDFAFNVGGGNLRNSTLLQVINAREFNRVPAQFRRWTMAGGKEWAGLKARREREIELFFDGVPRPRAAPPAGEDVSPIDIRRGERPKVASGRGSAPIASAERTSRRGHALLIAVGDYSGSGLESLQGPRNDIGLVRTLLKTRFALAEENILTLVDEAASHTKVQAAFGELTRRVNPGDFVYIHYAGHGSYAENKAERGGQDQTWVTFGARTKRSTGLDDRDVLDKEIRGWLTPLYDKTKDIIFVSDSCHSATVSRGLGTGVRAAVPDPRPHPLSSQSSDALASRPGVRIGAARDVESAVEIDVERGGQCLDLTRCHGVFTWYWVQALQQAKPGERWEDVFKRTYALVVVQRGVSQRPQLEGHGETMVFGGTFAALKPTIPVTAVDTAARTVALASGATNGVTKGSMYKLFDAESPGRSDLPTLEVVGLRPFVSDGAIRSGEFKVGDLVTESTHAYQFEPWKVHVTGDFADDLDRSLIARIEASVSNLPGFVVTGDKRLADWVAYVLRPGKDEADAIVAAGTPNLPPSLRDKQPEVWVITRQGALLHERMRVALDDPEKGVADLSGNLAKFARAAEIKRLQAHGGSTGVSIEVTVWRRDSSCRTLCRYLPNDERHERPYGKVGTYRLTENVASLKRGDFLTFSLKNDDQTVRYTYVLNISPAGAIQTVFPSRYENREEAVIKSNETRDLSELLLLDAPGIEVIKLIVTREPIDARLFESPGYLLSRGQQMNSLERLLAQTLSTRGEVQRYDSGEWGTTQAEFHVDQ